jgi:two-component system OmpR family response regulator
MNQKSKILLAEDDRNFGEVLCSYLEMNDYEVVLATDGETGLENFKKTNFDLCVLDVMMPKKDGFALAKDIKEINSSVPIIFLTAKTMKEDVIKGFKLGADDYISKPFSTEELLYRIQAVLKRSQKQEKQITENKEFNIGAYIFNYPLRTLSIQNSKDGVVSEKLSPKEAELLKLFCQHTNNILPRNLALKEIWGEDNYFTARSMDVFVTKLRKYLKHDTSIEIVNIHGNGFQLSVKEIVK